MKQAAPIKEQIELVAIAILRSRFSARLTSGLDTKYL
tara:strand:- start:617 stop:727 length:111 start_codon:yes stop_codon:yes gene_type:complete